MIDPLLSRHHAVRGALGRRRDREGHRRLEGRIAVRGGEHLRQPERIAARHPAVSGGIQKFSIVRLSIGHLD